MTPFYAWLREQAGRHDPVGDLARDASGDRGFQRASNSWGRCRAYLDRVNASEGALLAADRAWREFGTSLMIDALRKAEA